MTASAISLFTASFSLPFRLEYYAWWQAALLFFALGVPIVLLGMHAMTGMGRIRRGVTLSVRLLVLLLLVLLLAGLRWQRQAKDVEVYCLRDASDSTTMVQEFPGHSLQRSLDDYFVGLARDERKHPEDKIGVIGFRGIPLVEAIPDTTLHIDGRGTPVSSTGTDAASALQLAMAGLSPDTMHRLVLVWDGNQTVGDIDTAVAQAASLHIPIDVFPLHYDLKNEIMVERMIAPSWRRENEPFSLEIYIRSTNPGPVTGTLRVSHETRDGSFPVTAKPLHVKLEPGVNRENVRVPALNNGGVHRFHAEFTPDPGQGKVDTLDQNNTADAFTVVRGKGEVLYVNNFRDASGNFDQTLVNALRDEKITLHQVSVDQLPPGLLQLQDYDAVILDNVPRGAGGLSNEQDAMLGRYVQDLGGGLVMIGGDQSFGAGGWLGSEVEKILPVSMDIPAQRQVPKGALVLVMDPGEIPEGAYWGEQCAFQAINSLSAQDEVGIVDYNPSNGQCEWVAPLQEKGDGSRLHAAIRRMNDGDMPAFDQALSLVLDGDSAGHKGLLQSDARAKHVIIISDGDNMPASDSTIQRFVKAKISVSTVTAFAEDPSNPNVPSAMEDLPKATHGKAYGPLNRNPNQLPQIFIKEAQIVRRSLIHEDKNGIPVRLSDASDELMQGISAFEPLFGQVLVSKKNDPRVMMPLISGKMNDPVLAHWQAGLGKSVVFTGDAHWKWGALFTGSPAYSKFWSQVVRSVSREPMSSNFDVETRIDGSKGHVKVSAVDAEGGGQNFLNIGGSIISPDMKETTVRLDQTAPGVYEADFPAAEAGAYVAALHYRGAKGTSGMLMSGVSLDSSPEMRDLHSNDARLDEIAQRTGGRVLAPWDPIGADVFTREGLHPAMQSLPIWDVLLVILLGMVLMDVAVRRIAWDWESTKRMAGAVAESVRSFTTLRRGDAIGTLAALKDVRREVLSKRAEATAAAPVSPTSAPDPKARFTAPTGVHGNINDLVSGARATPIPSAPRSSGHPKGAAGPVTAMTDSLLDVKRRTRQRMQSENSGPSSDPPPGE